LAAVVGHFFDVHFVDGVVDLFSGADDPDLGSVVVRILQLFIRSLEPYSCKIRKGFGEKN